MPVAIADPRVLELRDRFSWEDVLTRFDWNPREGLNIAHEACVRWAANRGRVAMLWVDAGTAPIDRAWRPPVEVTYYDLHQASSRLANVLRRLGIDRGDRVSILLPKLPETFITALAVWKLGAVLVPLFGAFAAGALRYRLQHAEASVLITDSGYRDLAERALHQDVPVVVVPEPRGRGLRHGDRSFWEEVDAADPVFSTVQTRAVDPAAIIFTSGTTGEPKGCVIPHACLVGLVPFVEHVMALDAHDLMWATADPSWVFGLISTGMAPMALGFPSREAGA